MLPAAGRVRAGPLRKMPEGSLSHPYKTSRPPTNSPTEPRPPKCPCRGIIVRRKFQRRAKLASRLGRPARRHARESKIEMRPRIPRPLMHIVRPDQLRILIFRIAQKGARGKRRQQRSSTEFPRSTPPPRFRDKITHPPTTSEHHRRDQRQIHPMLRRDLRKYRQHAR